MTELMQVYKCEVCGNMVEIVHAAAGTLACCGQSMSLLTENTVDAATEKHVPVIEEIAGGFRVAVGEVLHPMEEAHLIEWVELITDGKSYRQHLKPGQTPEAVFAVEADAVAVREYCNLHGLWRADK